MREFSRLLAVALLLVPVLGWAATFSACDNYGQDWRITLGAFGGTFPGTQLISGCRDCNASLACGGTLKIDGALVFHGTSRIWSLTAYRPAGTTGSCVSTHWTGAQAKGSNTVTGNVSNEAGPFGAFTLNLKTTCVANATITDPSKHNSGMVWPQTP